MRLTSISLLAILLSTVYSPCQAQSLTGIIHDKNSQKSIVGAYVTLFKGDSIVSVKQTDDKGRFMFALQTQGEHTLTVSSLNYQNYELTFNPDTLAQPIILYLEENLANLFIDEVVITADKSQLVKRTANGQIFHLSKESQKQKNPFRALQEIPLLVSDESNSTLTLLNGKTPLILINGNRLNSGISPINPSDIESVEVINIVPARYLQEGYSGIVNIKLKKNNRPYLWTEIATRHDFPWRKGFGVFYFEIGNKKHSLYGRTSYNYTYHDDIENSVWRANTNYTQKFNSHQFTNEHSWLGELLYKWSATPQDYFAAHVYFKRDFSTVDDNGKGEYTEATTRNYDFTSRERNQGNILTSSIYYKHSFHENHDLEIRGAYNHNSNDFKSKRIEQWGEQVRQSHSLFDNIRHSGNIDIDYSQSFNSGYSLSLGSHTTAQYDKINPLDNGLTIFHHRKLNEYIFGSIGGKAGKILYLASAGMEMIWLKAGNANNKYIRPRIALSGTWTIQENHSLQLGYTLSNEAPEVSALNPYNTSTDSMLVSAGNPYLTPQMTHRLDFNYTFNRGGFYLMPSVSYIRIADLIEPTGFSENNIYHSSYNNLGHFSLMSYLIDMSIRFPWGRVGAGGGWTDSYYQGKPAKGSFSSYLDFSARVRKFSFYSSISYTNRDVHEIFTVKHYRPTMAQVQVNYNFTPDFYIALCLQDITGKVRTRTELTNDTYHSTVNQSFKDRNLRPWILIRYTFRKNTNKKIKLDNNILNSRENGIKIK